MPRITKHGEREVLRVVLFRPSGLPNELSFFAMSLPPFSWRCCDTLSLFDDSSSSSSSSAPPSERGGHTIVHIPVTSSRDEHVEHASDSIGSSCSRLIMFGGSSMMGETVGDCYEFNTGDVCV